MSPTQQIQDQRQSQEISQDLNTILAPNRRTENKNKEGNELDEEILRESMSTIAEVDSEPVSSELQFVTQGHHESPTGSYISERGAANVEEINNHSDINSSNDSRDIQQSSNSNKQSQQHLNNSLSPVIKLKLNNGLSGTLQALSAKLDRIKRESSISTLSDRDDDTDNGEKNQVELNDTLFSLLPFANNSENNEQQNVYTDIDFGKKTTKINANKSTVTSIDLSLMDKMVEKFFVSTQSVDCQTIEFDCLEFGETNPVMSRLQRNKRKQQTKSIGVGTEKFSRERFSLLPQTKTRSTQTNFKQQNDFGASETRKFRLENLKIYNNKELKKNNEEENSGKRVELNPESIDEESIYTESVKESNDIEMTTEPDEKSTNKEDDSRSFVEPKLATTVIDNKSNQEGEKKETEVDKIVQQNDQIHTTNNRSGAKDVKSRNEEICENNFVSKSKQNESNKKTDNINIVIDDNKNIDVNKSKEKKDVIDSRPANVKTELRVIIELSNGRKKSISEYNNESLICNDGKISKKIEVESKKLIAIPRLFDVKLVGDKMKQRNEKEELAKNCASPSQVFELLTQVGRQNCFSTSDQNKFNSSNDFDDCFCCYDWKEISKSKIGSEIQAMRYTDDNKKVRAGGTSCVGGGGTRDSEVIFKSETEIDDKKDKIEVSSSAVERNKSSGIERRLVSTKSKSFAKRNELEPNSGRSSSSSSSSGNSRKSCEQQQQNELFDDARGRQVQVTRQTKWHLNNNDNNCKQQSGALRELEIPKAVENQTELDTRESRHHIATSARKCDKHDNEDNNVDNDDCNEQDDNNDNHNNNFDGNKQANDDDNNNYDDDDKRRVVRRKSLGAGGQIASPVAHKVPINDDESQRRRRPRRRHEELAKAEFVFVKKDEPSASLLSPSTMVLSEVKEGSEKETKVNNDDGIGASFEIDKHSESLRRQVRGGKVVFDDKVSERHFERAIGRQALYLSQQQNQIAESKRQQLNGRGEQQLSRQNGKSRAGESSLKAPILFADDDDNNDVDNDNESYQNELIARMHYVGNTFRADANINNQHDKINKLSTNNDNDFDCTNACDSDTIDSGFAQRNSYNSTANHSTNFNHRLSLPVGVSLEERQYHSQQQQQKHNLQRGSGFVGGERRKVEFDNNCAELSSLEFVDDYQDELIDELSKSSSGKVGVNSAAEETSAYNVRKQQSGQQKRICAGEFYF